jgi:hypothetical protein
VCMFISAPGLCALIGARGTSRLGQGWRCRRCAAAHQQNACGHGPTSGELCSLPTPHAVYVEPTRAQETQHNKACIIYGNLNSYTGTSASSYQYMSEECHRIYIVTRNACGVSTWDYLHLFVSCHLCHCCVRAVCVSRSLHTGYTCVGLWTERGIETTHTGKVGGTPGVAGSCSFSAHATVRTRPYGYAEPERGGSRLVKV